MKTPLDPDASIQICTISAGMVGVCLTTIGLIRVVISLKNINTLADDLLSADALLFLSATLTAYWSLRTRNSRRLHKLERVADASFLLGIILMAAICVFITYAIA